MVIIAAGTLYSITGFVSSNAGSKVCVKQTNAFNRYADGMKEEMFDNAYFDYLCDKEMEQRPLLNEVFSHTTQNRPVQAAPTQQPQAPPTQQPQTPPTQRLPWSRRHPLMFTTTTSVINNVIRNALA